MSAWIEYGKTYKQLRLDLELAGESIVGLQVDIKRSEEYPALCPGGLHLVGNIEENCGGEDNWKGYSILDGVPILRYRRLITAEQLKE